MCRYLAACLCVSVADARVSPAHTHKHERARARTHTHTHTIGAHADWHAQHAQQAAREGDNRSGGKRKREEAAAFAKRVALLKKDEDMAELVEGLRAHLDDLAAVLAACQAMAHLTEGEQAEKAAAIARAGGIEAAVAAGAKHSGSAQVAEQVCRVLRGLAYKSDDRKARIAGAGGIEAVVRVLGEHRGSAAVMEQACMALFNIGWSDQALQKRIKDAGAEPLVRAALAAPDATDGTKNWGQRLLDKLGKV